MAFSEVNQLFASIFHANLQSVSQYFETFDVLPNFPFTTSETMGDYYLETWYIRVASRVAEQLKT